jgi:hypothetical protein
VFASIVRRSPVAVQFCSDGGHCKEAGSRIIDFNRAYWIYFASSVLFRWAVTAQAQAEREVDRPNPTPASQLVVASEQPSKRNAMHSPFMLEQNRVHISCNLAGGWLSPPPSLSIA